MPRLLMTDFASIQASWSLCPNLIVYLPKLASKSLLVIPAFRESKKQGFGAKILLISPKAQIQSQILVTPLCIFPEASG